MLFGLLLRVLGDTAAAEEVLLEVYAEVKQQAPHFDQHQESLLDWLITIAHRRALEHMCSTSEDRQFLISVGLSSTRRMDPTQAVSVRKSAHRRLVRGILNSLSPTERNMIEMAYFSRMTPRAIALRLGQSSDAVTACLQHGIARLDNLFRNQGPLAEVQGSLKRRGSA